MSQPPPYSPQQLPYGHPGGYPPEPPRSPEQLLAPARRAGTLMIVVGALSVLCGLYFAWWSGNFDATSAGLPPEMQRQFQQQVELTERQAGGMKFRTIILVMGIVPLVVGAVLGGLGFYVRGGSLGTIITGIVIVAGVLLVTGIALLAGVVQSGAMGGPVFAAAAICIYGVPFALTLMLMVWLVQAARAASQVVMARRQYQAQMGQYQQYQQAYLQQGQAPSQPPASSAPPQPSWMGYHYPRPQPPAPGPTTPPPADPPSERTGPPDGTPPQG